MFGFRRISAITRAKDKQQIILLYSRTPYFLVDGPGMWSATYCIIRGYGFSRLKIGSKT